MTDTLPNPLVPAECDLTDFKFMPLEVEQLRKSKAWLIARRRPELAFYMLNLWMRAWHSLSYRCSTLRRHVSSAFSAITG